MNVQGESIPRMPYSSVKSIAELQRRSSPRVITGAMESWAARSAWTPAYFERRCGDALVRIERGDIRSASLIVERVPFRDYIQEIAAPPAGRRSALPYLAQFPIFDEIEAVRGDAPEAPLHGSSYVSPVFFWLGPAGVGSPLHFDNAHNLIAQIYGRKRVVLFSPEDTKYLYKYPWFSTKRCFSRVSLDADPLDAFPLVARARPVECVLSPGEILFIPRGFWHFVVSLDLSINLNFFWKTWPMYLRQRIVAPAFTALGVRESSWVRRKAPRERRATS